MATETEAPECARHGVTVPRASSTREQRFCGDWYECADPSCATTVLVPGAELLDQLAEQRPAPMPKPGKPGRRRG